MATEVQIPKNSCKFWVATQPASNSNFGKRDKRFPRVNWLEKPLKHIEMEREKEKHNQTSMWWFEWECPHKLICSNTCSLVGGTISEELGDVALLEKVHHGDGHRIHKAHTISRVPSASCLSTKGWALASSCHDGITMPSWTLTLRNRKPN